MMMMMMMMMTLACPGPRGQLQPRGAPPISRAALCTCSDRSGRSNRSDRSIRHYLVRWKTHDNARPTVRFTVGIRHYLVRWKTHDNARPTVDPVHSRD
jgi:hypothetical protein